MTAREARAAASRGAKYLDKQLGRGWRRKIRLRNLRMSRGYYNGPNDCGCILAQLYGEYRVGLREVGLRETGDEQKESRLGFTLNHGDWDDWENLAVAWKEELRR